MNTSADIDSDLLDLSSKHAGLVIAMLVDKKSPNDPKVLEALHLSQANLLRDVVARVDSSGEALAGVVWVNTYFAENFEDIPTNTLTPRLSPKLFYVFAPSAFYAQEQDLCNRIHDDITNQIPRHNVHLSHLLAEKNAPEEVRFRLGLSESGESCLIPVGASSEFGQDHRQGIQWYREVLFPGALSENPERSTWIYVHLGLPHRNRITVREAGVYLMMRSEEKWQTLRPHLRVAFRNFLSEILFTHTYQRLQDKGGDATEVFATASHELNALYEKHFTLIKSELAKPGLEKIANAWMQTSAMAWLGWLFGKMMAAYWRRDRRGVEQCKISFCTPLQTLAKAGRLPDALQMVAREVAISEKRTTDVDGGSVTFSGDHDLSPSSLPPLSDQEFVVCYLLVAEPVRNHIRHGRGIAEWRVDDTSSQDKLTIVLKSERLRNISSIPSSTFENLGKLLDVLSKEHRIGSSATHVQQDNCELWQVTIGRPLFSVD